MITIEAYMGQPADICPPPTSNNSQHRSSTGNIYEDYSESSDSDDEDNMKKPAASSSRDHADPFSKLVESTARTESTRKYLEESRRMYSSIPDFHRYSNSAERTHSIPAKNNNTSSSSLLNYASDANMNASFSSSSVSSSNFHSSNHNSTPSFHTSFNSSSTTLAISEENSPTSVEHQSRMSNLLTAMERTEQSRALLRRRSEECGQRQRRECHQHLFRGDGTGWWGQEEPWCKPTEVVSAPVLGLYITFILILASCTN